MGAIFTLIRRSLKSAWRRRWLGVAIAWIICVGGWLVIHKLPDQYVANARLYVNTDAVLTPLLKGLAVDASPEAQLKVLQGTLVSRPNLQTLISKTDLDLTVAGPTQRDALDSPTGERHFGKARQQAEPVLDSVHQQRSQAGTRRRAGAADDLHRQRDRLRPA